jgi:hypothetical protein
VRRSQTNRARFLLLPLLFAGCVSWRPASQPLPYRDLQIYAESSPVADSAIECRVSIVNRGPRQLELSARLQANEALASKALRWQKVLAQGTHEQWRFLLELPPGFSRTELEGAIYLRGELDRQLVLGVARDTDAAMITGCFTPRPSTPPAPTPRRTVLLGGFRILDTMPASAIPGSRSSLSAAVRDLQRVGRQLTREAMPLVADSAGPSILITQSDDPRVAPAGSYHLRIRPGFLALCVLSSRTKLNAAISQSLRPSENARAATLLHKRLQLSRSSASEKRRSRLGSPSNCAVTKS